jgi:hypothetical protein
MSQLSIERHMFDTGTPAHDVLDSNRIIFKFLIESDQETRIHGGRQEVYNRKIFKFLIQSEDTWQASRGTTSSDTICSTESQFRISKIGIYYVHICHVTIFHVTIPTRSKSFSVKSRHVPSCPVTTPSYHFVLLHLFY